MARVGAVRLVPALLLGGLSACSGAAATVGEIQTPVDLPFSALVSQLTGIFSGHFEGLRGPYGFGVDYLYASVGKGGIDTPVPGVTINDSAF